ncbi:MAG: hypothetical protein RLZZ214_4343 [Verrucomicrobiota bacterium]|jgi:hypothetical protein
MVYPSGVMCILKTYSVEITAKDIHTDEDGRKYFINPLTMQKRYYDEIKNHRITFTLIPNPAGF